MIDLVRYLFDALFYKKNNLMVYSLNTVDVFGVVFFPGHFACHNKDTNSVTSKVKHLFS